MDVSMKKQKWPDAFYEKTKATQSHQKVKTVG
jgi:hypothetical protein